MSGGDAPARGSAERYAALFATESHTLLAAAADGLAAIGKGDGADQGAVDAVFRAMHSLKGMAGAMHYEAVQALAHEVETVLAAARDGAIALTPERVDALVAAVDGLDVVVDAALAGRALDVSADVESLRLLARDAPDAHAAAAAAVVRPSLAPEPGTVVVHARISPATPLPGARAMLVVRRLEALGVAEAVVPPRDALLDVAFDGAVSVRLRTKASPDALAEAARSAGDVAEVRVVAFRRAADTKPTEAPVRDAREAREARGVREVRARAEHVRVERARLDALLDVAGELAHARARLASVASGIGDPAIVAAVADVVRLVGALHEEVRGTRTAPAADVFERLPRVVRDVARAVGKRAELVLEGGDVALDRAVLEELTEPLVHLLRNAVDHGLESPEERVAAGKPASGRIVLRAERERDAVLVSVRDDGRGIDRARVLSRADAGDHAAETFDDEALLDLLARPGFTTAARVSSVSGRGVGVDAVRDRVRRVGGTLALSTTPGEGTRFTMRLPLTLALGRALVTRAGGQAYAVPVGHVRETAEVPSAAITRDGDRATLRLRDDTLPALSLASLVGVACDPSTASKDEASGSPETWEVAVVECTGRRVAVLVDAIDGQQDVLVKPLPPLRGALRIFGGATILVDGTPALVLDAPALVHRSLA